MPIYEYECKACGHQLEAFQKMSEPVLTTCPACGDTTSLQKLVSAAGFQLKGTGWYVTDFKNKNKPETKPSATTEATPSDVNKTSTGDSSSSATASVSSTPSSTKGDVAA